MSAIAKQINQRTFIIAHRDESITQTHDKFKLFWPTVDIGICIGDRNDVNNQVIIDSVQSCCKPKRLERLRERNFTVLMIVEAHHSTSD
jgi:superfamily II DNA or RNA helicase